MDELEREIEKALAVEPSPDFPARIRRRIADEHIASPWLGSWQLAGAACGVAMFAVVMTWERHEPTDITGLGIPQLRGRAISSELTPLAPAATPSGLSELIQPGARPRGRSPDRIRREPEVLIAQDEAAALKRLLRGDQTQLLDAPISDRPTRVALEPPKTIALSPVAEIGVINIEPLRIAADQGGRQ